MGGDIDRLCADLTERGKQCDALTAELQESREKALQKAQLEARNLRRIIHEREHSSIMSPEWGYDPYNTTRSDEPAHVDHECPSCKKTLQIPREFVGSYGTCKFCGSDIEVQKDAE